MSRLLVVDDDIQMLSALEAALRRKGHVVETASNGLEAVAKLDSPFQAVITDLRMPGMNGLELLASLRRLAPVVPSIMLTAHGSIETYLKACSLGVFEYVNKPVTAQELGRIVKAALGRAQTVERYAHDHTAAREG